MLLKLVSPTEIIGLSTVLDPSWVSYVLIVPQSVSRYLIK